MTVVYRLVLHLLPSELRRKHGCAMHALFVREMHEARAHGWLRVVLAGGLGIWDVLQRAAYEQVRVHPASGLANRSPSDGVWDMHTPVPPQPSTRQLVRSLAVAFVIAFVALTSVLLVNYARMQMDRSGNETWRMVLLALPFTAAMTIPVAVFIAVLYEFTRMGGNGTLAAARRMRGGVRRLAVPVVVAATGVAALALVVTAEIVPRANAQLSVVMHGERFRQNDRSMTISELRYAARNVSPGQVRRDDGVRLTEHAALSIAAEYEVEVQKKLALPAACIVLALAGMAIAFRVPRGGTSLVIGATIAVIGSYYVLLMTGETFAERLVVSPFVGMWGANALMLTTALLALGWRHASPTPPAPELA